LWLHSLKVAQLLRSAACLHTNQSRSYLNHLVTKQTTWNSLCWEANNFCASQEIVRSLWNRKVHYHIIKRLTLASILSQINSLHTCSYYFLKIYFNIIIQSKARSSSGLLPSALPTKACIHSSYLPIRTTFPTYLILLTFITRSTDHKVPHYVVPETALLPCPSYAQISSLATYSHSALNVKDQVSHP